MGNGPINIACHLVMKSRVSCMPACRLIVTKLTLFKLTLFLKAEIYSLRTMIIFQPQISVNFNLRRCHVFGMFYSKREVMISCKRINTNSFFCIIILLVRTLSADQSTDQHHCSNTGIIYHCVVQISS